LPADGRLVEHTLYDAHGLSPRERYQLLTSLVVPRPIGWISTTSEERVPNLAPFSYFAALASSPMLIGVSIGHHRDGTAKDTLVNIRATRVFCANVVTSDQLARMNATSARFSAEVSEFERCDVPIAWSEVADAPFVADARAVLECALSQEVDLGEAPNTLVIGEVLRVRVRRGMPTEPGTLRVDARSLEPIGRLGGTAYAMPGEVVELDRP
jgi:flavin reductase (DIM6/NTAB) family NADH-FMN oxidoreductase RutF